MTHEETVKRIIGKIVPTSDANTDGDRLENLKNMCTLIEKLVVEVDHVATRFKDSPYDSEKACGQYASDFIGKLGQK